MFAAVHSTADDAEKLLRLAQEFSPQVEQTATDTVSMDAEGLERIHGLPQQIAASLARRAAERGLRASVAIGANLDAAVHAARGFAGVHVIPYGDEGKYLGSLHHIIAVQRGYDATVLVDPLGNRQPEIARNEGRRCLVGEVIPLLAVT